MPRHMVYSPVADGYQFGTSEIDAIYRTAPIGLCVLDREMRFVRINERFADITGIAPEAHIGRTVRETLPTLVDQVEPLFQRVLDTGEPLLGVELHGETPAQPGVERIWIDNWAPLKDPQGNVVAINISVEEVTETRRLEKLQEEQRRMQALAAALQQARERDRVSLVRDLQEHITAPLTEASEALTRLSSEELPPSIEQHVSAIAAALHASLDAVRRISRELRPSTLDVIGVSAAIREKVENFRQESGIEVKLTTPESEPAVTDAAGTALFRVLQEALLNAARHSGATEVEVTLRDEAKDVILVVRDNGGAISAEPLGLKEQMESFGGTLALRSAPSSGSYLIACAPHA